MTAFEELGMVPELSKAIDEMEWTLPTDIQSEAIPAILGGSDVLMAAETGSGKTGAFCLPVLQIVWESLRDQSRSKTRKTFSFVDEKWCLNVYDRDGDLAVDQSGLRCQSRDPQKWNGARCNRGVFGKGKFYYECTITDDGLCRVGWSTANASLDLGTDRNSFGYGGTGKKSYNKQFDNYGTSFTLGDVIGCLLDLDENCIAFSKNGQCFGKAFDIPSTLQNIVLYPAVVLKNAEILFNYGESEFKYLPKGFVAISNAPTANVVSSNGSSGESKKVKIDNSAPSCIIIEPTKELAEQTNAQLEKFKKYLSEPSLRSALVVGSISVSEQLRMIAAGVDIITCTPGRLEDFIQSGKISVQNIRFFILDEADSLISAKAHLPTIERIHASLPKITVDGDRLQMIVCSATLHNFDIKKLADRMMHFPQWVDLKGQDSVPDTVHHVVCMVDAKSDLMWIRLKNTDRIKTDGIHAYDQLRPGSEIPETLSEGTKILKGEYVVKKGKVRFLICTDVAARGIDVKGVPYVINVTLPDEKTNYLHRIGRIGRAERMGLAISLVSTLPEKVWYHKCPSRGVNCNNTSLVTQRGCAIWYEEAKLIANVCYTFCMKQRIVQILQEVEEHLGITISQIDTDMVVPVNEFDGKVTYGAKKTTAGSLYEGHAVQLSGAVAQLADLERSLQLSFLHMFMKEEKAQ